MPIGARLHRFLSMSTQARFWRAVAFWLCLISLLYKWTPLGSTHPHIWAQASPAPHLLISEIHPAAKAVEDNLGEWFEIHNPGPEAVNLQFWSIINQGNAEHLFPFALWVPAGGYVVLASFADSAQNGGVQPAYVYTPFSLSNASEQLTLRDPEGQTIDSVAWGEGTERPITSGVSWERSAPNLDAPWVLSHAPWPGSAGDWGSPGAPYTPPPTATPTPLPTPTATPPPDVPPRLRISEIMANPAAVSDDLGEWVELFNGDTVPINLNGWVLADLDSDHAVLVGDLWLPPGGYLVVARVADPAQNGGVVAAMTYAGMQLANEADELRLITPWGVETERVAWDGNARAIVEGASLQRTTFAADAAWATAYFVWPGSAGDLGSPGAPYAPAPTATPTATPTPLPSPTALPTPPPAVLPRLFISEVMANPAAVGDELGEWVELFNGDTVPINLSGWILADQGRDRALLAGDLWLEPGQYIVLTRMDDPAQNGGVIAAQSYTGLQLANEEDELFLLAPWGARVDQLVWGNGTLRIPDGASLERTSFDAAASWATAHAPWPGSAGDRGSPGAPYRAPTPTPIPTDTATPTAQPSPTLTATATPSPTALPGGWGRRAIASPLIIAQVYPQGSDEEYVVLTNISGVPLPLAGWRLGDAEVPGDREGMLRLLADVSLAPGASWVIARHAVTFRARWGRDPDAEWSNSNPALPQLSRDPILASGEMALANDGDEVLLLDPDGALADAVAWEDGSYATLYLSGDLDLPSQSALFQAPGAPFTNVSDVRHRFMLLPPNPFATFTLPTLPAHPPVPLDGGLIARWGSLGAASTFSDGGTLPPHVLLAAAGALGLDFLAIADHDRAPTDLVVRATAGGPTLLLAWRWQLPEGDEAIIYSDRAAILLGWGELLEFLRQENALAQLPPSLARDSQRTPLLQADAVSAPGNLAALQAAWQESATPLLPAGNTTPLLPGSSALAPHFTGLAAANGDAAALLEAVAARRGWLTSSPGLWLTLRTADGTWMGSTVAPTNELTLHIAYGDSRGESAGLALWQGDQLVRQLDLPPADGRWTVTLPAAPGSMLYVVATQLDGDFAITAPIRVMPAEGGKVVINEVLPAPGADHNGDGQVNTDDEFIELVNTGSAPLSLAGYALDDAATATGGRRFTFGTDRFIGAGERLLLWRADTGLNLNDDADFLQLLDANGTLIDQIAWEQRDRGPSLSRVPDGGEWQSKTPPTPGQANQAFPPPTPAPHREPEKPPLDPTDVGDPHSPNFGQASGAPGSVALAKLRGLQTTVEFRAQVIVPPGLFPSAIYVADAARDENGTPMPIAGLGIQVYLRGGDFMPMQEGDWLLVRGGVVKSFRGEMEVQIDEPGQAWPEAPGTPLAPLPTTVSAIGEALEGRLVSFTGTVTGWQGDSLYLGDPANPEAPSIRVTVRSSLGWKRPYVQIGEQYFVIGVVSQFGTAAPWNDGYRVLVRFQNDIQAIEPTASTDED